MADNQNKGFGSMKEDLQRDVASKGGQASSSKQDMGELGHKGGQASGGKFKNDPQKASEAGRMGGQASRNNSDDQD